MTLFGGYCDFDVSGALGVQHTSAKSKGLMLSVSWACHGQILGISWTHLEHVLGINLLYPGLWVLFWNFCI